MRRCCWLLCALLAACSDPPLPSPEGGSTREQAAVSELAYVMDVEEAAAIFAEGNHEWVPARAFQAVDVHYVQQGGAPLEYQLFLGEVWTDWTPVVTESDDDTRHTGLIETPGPAFALRMRGGNRLDFARLEFFSSRLPEQSAGFDDDPVGSESHDDQVRSLSEEEQEKVARDGRWALPQATRTAGEARNIPYTGAGNSCAGGMRPGARVLGQYLVDQFRGARSFEGYACRQIRGGSGLSVHASGRAVDVFVPLDRGAADNDLGDPIANWLVENAATLGVQLVIWDRTIWNGSRSPRDRQYTGEHPHHDHLHIELTPAAAERSTAIGALVAGGPPADGGAGNGGNGGGQPGCASSTLGRMVAHGECVQVSYEGCGGTCRWYQCDAGGWSCAGDLSACGAQVANPSCGGPAPRRSCESRSLGRSVPDGDCVQMDYDACGGTCRWARCDDGGWACTDEAACNGRNPDAACNAAPPPQPPAGVRCDSRTLGQSVPEGDRVQMAYDACGGTCHWAVCDGGDWVCTNQAGSGQDHPHVQCQAAPPVAQPAGDACYSRTLGQSVPHGDRVQMSYAACSGNRRCNWAVCDDGEFRCTTEDSPGADHPHRDCR